jgi:hypothetical protein
MMQTIRNEIAESIFNGLVDELSEELAEMDAL